MKGIPNSTNSKIPRGGVARKPARSLEDQAADLVEEANQVALNHDRQIAFDETPAVAEKISDGIVYGYLVGQLRCRSKDIVAEALAQRFQMSSEDFAIDILGG